MIDIKECAALLREDGVLEDFLKFIFQVHECETKEVLQNEKPEHIKSVKAIGRIIAKLPESKKKY